jgi:hypothetical protein
MHLGGNERALERSVHEAAAVPTALRPPHASTGEVLRALSTTAVDPGFACIPE